MLLSNGYRSRFIPGLEQLEEIRCGFRRGDSGQIQPAREPSPPGRSREERGRMIETEPAEQATASALDIDRRHNLSYEEFSEEYLSPRKPVIITDALTPWRAVYTWTPEFFAEKFATVPVTVDGKSYSMTEFIERVVSSSPESPAPYLRNEVIDQFLPELLADIQPLPAYFSPNWLEGPFSRPLRSRLHGGSPELYIGGRGGKFPFLHFDSYHTHAFLCQVYGTKEYTAYTADQTPFLYVRPNQYNASQVADLENPDLVKFPLFAKAIPIRFRLEAGETLFVPGGRWHTAKMLTPSITVSVNRANASNWSHLTHDMYAHAPLPLKPLTAVYLTGMRVFRTLCGS